MLGEIIIINVSSSTTVDSVVSFAPYSFNPNQGERDCTIRRYNCIFAIGISLSLFIKVVRVVVVNLHFVSFIILEKKLFFFTLY